MDFLSMSYEEIIAYFRKKLPKFSDGRINYNGSTELFVLNVFVQYKNEILLLKRSNKVMKYQGKWNSIGGFIDEEKSAEQKAYEEVEEELGITSEKIQKIHIGKIRLILDTQINVTRIVVPIIAYLAEKPAISLDREHTEYQWIPITDIIKFDIIPELEKTYQCAQENNDQK